jgi:hypothetical protein
MRLHQKHAVKTGGSVRIALPLVWVAAEGIEPGQKLDVLESGLLVVLPRRELKEDEITEALECVKRMIKIAYRNRGS